MESLNVAFYTDSYLPCVDGVVTSILTFRDELERRGHNVYIFGSAQSKDKKRYENRKVFLYSGMKFKPYPQYSVALFPYNSMIRLNELKTDLVHAQTPLVMGFAGLMGAKLLKYPIIGTFHTIVANKPVIDAYYPKNRHLKKFAARSLMKYTRFFYNQCDRVIAPSNAIKSMLNGYGISNVSTVPNCIDTSRFNPKVNGDAMRDSLKLNQRNRTVLYLGRLSREKKLEVLLKAVKLLARRDSKLKLIIGGTGPAEHFYKETVRKLGITDNVKFVGFVSPSSLPKLYAASDVLCLPSTFETQGMVTIEAMATGKPAVGADYLALSELIRNGVNGEKFRPGDYTDCAKKIEKVLNNTRRYKNGAVNTAVEFSKEKVTGRLLEVYNSALSDKAIN
jgi:1,2-diacylglycerol 3-alpha-glucosyltransferase